MKCIFFCHAVTKRFRLGLNAAHLRNLNFLLRSKIFVYYDDQLRASHLILGYVPLYTSYQDPGQVLIIGSPLLLYIGVCLRGFLSKGLSLGEARRLDPF